MRRLVPALVIAIAACGGGAVDGAEAAERMLRMDAAGIINEPRNLGLLTRDLNNYGGGSGYDCKKGDLTEELFWAMSADQGPNTFTRSLAYEVAFCPHRSAIEIAQAVAEGLGLPIGDVQPLIEDMVDAADG